MNGGKFKSFPSGGLNSLKRRSMDIATQLSDERNDRMKRAVDSASVRAIYETASMVSGDRNHSGRNGCYCNEMRPKTRRRLAGWTPVRQGAANGTDRRIMKSRKSMGVGNRSEQIPSSAHLGPGRNDFWGGDPAGRRRRHGNDGP